MIRILSSCQIILFLSQQEQNSLCLLEKAVVREKQIERWGSRREERRKLVRKLAFYNFCRIRWRGVRVRSVPSSREHYHAVLS